MQLDTFFPPATRLQDIPAMGRAAEQLGFDGVWIAETQHNPFLPCALLAEHTHRLQVGTAIAVSFARSPAVLAHTAWDLADASGGRFVLGLGTQVKAHIERRFGLPWPVSPVNKQREQIEALRAFWQTWQTGSKLNYRGEYYKLTLSTPFFTPAPIKTPDIPVYIAGVNTGLARLAGELADGFHVHPFHSPRYLRQVILPAIYDGAKKAGREKNDIKIVVPVFTISSPEERAFVRQQLAFYASTPSYRSVLQLHGWQAVAETLSSLAARNQWDEMPALFSDDMLQEFAMIARPDELAAALKERYAGIADRLMIYSPFIPGEQDAFWKQIRKDF
ncbi:MAG: TIGR03617 family F420-dependent LLM class oxidoreductase [Anaerolineae bacterium]|nr:TIGR03617 family F420-dependent LLM class oxidoreductase [Anaerolineae bacterium]